MDKKKKTTHSPRKSRKERDQILEDDHNKALQKQSILATHYGTTE